MRSGRGVLVVTAAAETYTLSVARRGCRDCPDEETKPRYSEELDKELLYHYDRSEREGRRQRPLPGHSGRNPFRGNRSLLILAVDVIIVLLLGGIYFTFLRGDPSETEIDGYRFTLEARSFEEETLLTLSVTDLEGSALPGEPFMLRLLEPLPEVVAEGLDPDRLSPEVDRLLSGEAIYDLLPAEDRRTVRLLLPTRLEAERVTFLVGWGETREELTAPLLGER